MFEQQGAELRRIMQRLPLGAKGFDSIPGSLTLFASREVFETRVSTFIIPKMVDIFLRARYLASAISSGYGEYFTHIRHVTEDHPYNPELVLVELLSEQPGLSAWIYPSKRYITKTDDATIPASEYLLKGQAAKAYKFIQELPEYKALIRAYITLGGDLLPGGNKRRDGMGFKNDLPKVEECKEWDETTKRQVLARYWQERAESDTRALEKARNELQQQLKEEEGSRDSGRQVKLRDIGFHMPHWRATYLEELKGYIKAEQDEVQKLLENGLIPPLDPGKIRLLLSEKVKQVLSS